MVSIRYQTTISPIQIDFKTQATGFDPVSAPHVEPVKAMDSNIKMYKVKTADAELNVEIAKMLCQNENSHERFPVCSNDLVATRRGHHVYLFYRMWSVCYGYRPRGYLAIGTDQNRYCDGNSFQ